MQKQSTSQMQGRIINKLLRPLGLRVQRLDPTQKNDSVRAQLHLKKPPIDPIQRNKKTTLDSLWSDPEFIQSYNNDHKHGLYTSVIEAIKSLAENHSFDTILDAGCGPGIFTKLLTETFPKKTIHACDFSEAAISRTMATCPSVKAFVHDLYSPLPQDYDLVVCMETIEHLVRYPQALTTILDAAPQAIITIPEGRADSFRGHINFWTTVSFEFLLSSTPKIASHTVKLINRDQNILAIVERHESATGDRNVRAHT